MMQRYIMKYVAAAAATDMFVCRDLALSKQRALFTQQHNLNSYFYFLFWFSIMTLKYFLLCRKVGQKKNHIERMSTMECCIMNENYFLKCISSADKIGRHRKKFTIIFGPLSNIHRVAPFKL